MTTIEDLLKQGRTDEAWQRCCGFIDLSLPDFMRIQNRLLQEQLELMKRSELGRYLMNGAARTSTPTGPRPSFWSIAQMRSWMHPDARSLTARK